MTALGRYAQTDSTHAPPEVPLIAAIADRQQTLRTLGRWTGRAGAALLGLGVLVMAPDPAGRDLFGDDPHNLYAAVPAQLYDYLQTQGAAVRSMPPGWGHGGATTFSVFGIYLLMFLVTHILAGWLVPSPRTRAILLLTFPLWFGFTFLILSALGWAIIPLILVAGPMAYPLLGRVKIIAIGRMAAIAALPVGVYLAASGAYLVVNGQIGVKEAFTARLGTVADHPGGPAVPPDGTVSEDPRPLRAVGADLRDATPEVPMGWVTPYHIRTEALAQPLRDQAHYLLAQQAYMHDDSANAAKHLRRMAGAWMPTDWHTRGRIGAVATWARLNGANPGDRPTRIAQGAPYMAPRYVVGWLLVISGCLAGSAGIYFCHLSQKLYEASAKARSALTKNLAGRFA